ncbi:MAG: FkbM family methyltransferase [Vicinamibacterales bacterium]
MRSLMRGALRRTASLPLRLVDPALRAEALDRLAREATVTLALGGGDAITFFAPSPLLRSRAAGVLDKEPDMIQWIDALPADAVLWDIGANVGVFSLYAATRRRCRVLAFEPSAANYFALTRNIQLNALSARIESYCVALSGATELGTLNLDSAEIGTAMSQFSATGEASRYSSGQGNVTHGMIGFTIDDFIGRFAPAFPTHLKIDVDGLEWPILQGASATLRDRRLVSAMVELSVTDRAERDRAMAFLGGAGLEFVSQGASQGANAEAAANHLFTRQAGAR